MTNPLRATAVPAAHLTGARAPGPSRTPEGLLRANRRAAYTAFTWVAVFLAWHVVWAVTGLEFPSASQHEGSGRVAMELYGVITLVMVAVGVVLPLALAQRWGRHVPRSMLLLGTWTGCALLAVRGFTGVADDLVRLTGLLPNGLTGLTTAQVLGSAHPSAWALIASGATDFLFAAGGLAFGAAAVTYRRVRPSR